MPFACAKGFSLLELLFSIALLSVVLFWAIPSFSLLLSRGQLNSDISSVRVAISTARMTAVSKKSQVIVCSWDGIHGCTGNAGTGTLVWQNGLFVYIDTNDNKAWDPLIDEALKILPFSSSNTISWNNGEKVIFKSDGSSPGYNGTFVLDGSLDSVEGKLVLSRTGRLRSG